MGNPGMVQTVLGTVTAESLGHTQTHEHLLCDLSAILDVGDSVGRAVPEHGRAGYGEMRTASARQMREKPVSLQDYDQDSGHGVIIRERSARVLTSQARCHVTGLVVGQVLTQF